MTISIPAFNAVAVETNSRQRPGDRCMPGLKLRMTYDDKWEQPASNYLWVYTKA
jgi:hypothetical protein